MTREHTLEGSVMVNSDGGFVQESMDAHASLGQYVSVCRGNAVERFHETDVSVDVLSVRIDRMTMEDGFLHYRAVADSN